MSNRNKNDYSFRLKLGRGKKSFSFVSGQGRRSGKDRRKTPVRDYFMNGWLREGVGQNADSCGI